MALEIERRFLVTGDQWQPGAVAASVVQGYLSTSPGRVVRVRLTGGQGFLTIKGPSAGPTRSEFEYRVPADDAREMLALCGEAVVEKTRWQVRHDGNDWVVDVFAGANRGLVLAEIELPGADHPFVLPPWVGLEVTGDHRYANASLAVRPFATFGDPGPEPADGA